jgi:hypothetical protein
VFVERERLARLLCLLFVVADHALPVVASAQARVPVVRRQRGRDGGVDRGYPYRAAPPPSQPLDRRTRCAFRVVSCRRLRVVCVVSC